MSGETIHASAVARDGRALLILGPAGSGKSSLALDLVGLGAALVADDLVTLTEAAEGIVVGPLRPGPTQRIEARGIGVLRLPAAAPAPVRLVLDLGREEVERLPPRRLWRGRAPLLFRPVQLPAAALLLALDHGGPEDPEAPVDA